MPGLPSPPDLARTDAPSGPSPWAAVAVGGVGLAVTALAAASASLAHHASVRADMVEHAHARIQAVAEAVAASGTEVLALQALYLSSEVVEEQEFTTFAATLLAAGNAAAFEWAPRVTDRVAWEREHSPLTVTQTGEVGLEPAIPRGEHFPVEMIVPAKGNERARGFDLGSEPIRAGLLDRARNQRRVVSGGPIDFVQGGEGFLTVAPVFGTDELHGFVLSVNRADDLLSAGLARMPAEDLLVRLWLEGPHGDAVLGTWPAGAEGVAPDARVSERVELPAGAFRIEVEPTLAFAAAHRSGAPWWVMAAGLSLTALLAGYVRLLGARTAAAREHAARLTAEVQERRRAEQAASELEARFRALAEGAPVGIYLLQDGRFQYVNTRFADLFGKSVEEIVGRLGPAEIHVGAPEAWLPGDHDPEVEVGPRRLELHAASTRIDGREAVVGTVTDVTALRRAEAERQRAEQLEALGVLAAAIAHDFNNLLAVILGSVSMAQLRSRDAALEQAENAVLRAQGLTAQLSSFARGGEPVRTPVNIEAIVREAVAFALRGSMVEARVEIGEGLWRVDADGGQLSRVFHNLVLNAVQAMDGRGVVTVNVNNHLHDSPPGRYVAVRVSDRGRGMEPEIMDRVFDPYFSTKSAGRGLGLASAHSIVRRHHGTIEVASRPGEGASFTVLLPAEEGAAESDTKAPAPARSSGGERVLVMDDDPFVRGAAARLVESHGYVVVAVEDGQEAVAAWRGAIAEGRPFAAALLDLTVPGGLGGREAIAEILTFDPDARGIASSGYADDPIMAGFREHGFAAVLPKPYRRDELGEVLRRVITGS